MTEPTTEPTTEATASSNEFDGLDSLGIGYSLQTVLEHLVDGNDEDEKITATVDEVLDVVDKLLREQAWRLVRTGMTACDQAMTLDNGKLVECMGEKGHPGETHGAHLDPKILGDGMEGVRVTSTWNASTGETAGHGAG